MALERICYEFAAETLYVFGSQAKRIRDWVEEQQDNLSLGPSDVDIGVRVIMKGSWPVTEKVRLAIALEDLLGCTRVDLVSLTEADPFLAVQVIRGERLFARDEHEADEYDLYILRRAGDLAPVERERMALVLGEAG